MLRLVIKALRPTEAELRKKKPSFSSKMKMLIHRCLVKTLTRFYRHYAVYDILNLNNGVRVVIETRDPGFEYEVKCAKLETKQQFQPLRTLPQNGKQSRRGIRWFNRCFNWQHKVIVTNTAGKTVVIDHTSRISLSGDMKICAELAKPNSLINTVKLTPLKDERRTISLEYQQDDPSVPSKPSRAKPSSRRRVPPPSRIPSSIIPIGQEESSLGGQEIKANNTSHRANPDDDLSKGSIQPTVIEEKEKPVQIPTRPLKKMKGFDMDDSF